jgi:hypothetical protein
MTDSAKVLAVSTLAISKLKDILLDNKLGKTADIEKRLVEVGRVLVSSFEETPPRPVETYTQIFICPICQKPIEDRKYVLLGSDKYHEACYKYMLEQNEEERRIWREILDESANSM